MARVTVALFEREYHTLRSSRTRASSRSTTTASTTSGPYYTMELLPGHDLRELAPLPCRQACALPARRRSSLALLHSRRLLHRDVSPRNVRCTDGRPRQADRLRRADGLRRGEPRGRHAAVRRARGRARRAARPAHRSVRARRHRVLRADAPPRVPRAGDLGAARGLAAARAAPSQYAPSVPAALDELVLSLLNLDPLARPESAAEVIDRLNAIAGLPSDDEPLAARQLLLEHGAGRPRGAARARYSGALRAPSPRARARRSCSRAGRAWAARGC